jgi:hypothetical protein
VDTARLLPLPELAIERSHKPGLFPVAINSVRREATWLDLNGFHCYEGFFHQSLATYRAISKTPPSQFRTDLEFLHSAPVEPCLAPTGFIFHAGRCGSTLLAKVLARSRSNLVFSEAAPHNQIWHVLRPGAAENIQLYRNLILTMGRKRVASHKHHLIKFTSFNIRHFPTIRAAFPDVPSLFLFRDPQAVLASYARNPPPWMGRDPGIDEMPGDAPGAVETFFRAAALIEDPNYRCLDYKDLNAAVLPAILSFLRVEECAEEARLMSSQFGWDSKAERAPRPFEPLLQSPSGALPGTIRGLYDKLSQRSESMWKP